MLAQLRVGIRIAELRLPLENQLGSPSEFSLTGFHLMKACRGVSPYGANCNFPRLCSFASDPGPALYG